MCLSLYYIHYYSGALLPGVGHEGVIGGVRHTKGHTKSASVSATGSSNRHSELQPLDTNIDAVLKRLVHSVLMQKSTSNFHPHFLITFLLNYFLRISIV